MWKITSKYWLKQRLSFIELDLQGVQSISPLPALFTPYMSRHLWVVTNMLEVGVVGGGVVLLLLSYRVVLGSSSICTDVNLYLRLCPLEWESIWQIARVSSQIPLRRLQRLFVGPRALLEILLRSFVTQFIKRKKYIDMQRIRLKPQPNQNLNSIGENVHTWKRNTSSYSKTVWLDTSIYTIQTFIDTTVLIFGNSCMPFYDLI